jgi:hypothetical protein
MQIAEHFRFALFAGAAFLGAHAYAASPLTTDDAGVLERGECEFSAYASHANAQGAATRGLQSSLNCGAFGTTQLGIGLAGSQDAAGSTDIVSISAKTRLFSGATDAPSFSVGYGATSARAPGNGWSSASYSLNGIATFPLSETATLHANLGLSRDNSTAPSQTLGTWGIAAEYAFSPSLSLLAETYGQQSSAPWVGIGARWQASKSWSIGAELSSQANNATQFTLGATLAF